MSALGHTEACTAQHGRGEHVYKSNNIIKYQYINEEDFQTQARETQDVK